jgi:hypothetical protein
MEVTMRLPTLSAVAAAAVAVVAQPALALNPPPVTQQLFQWTYELDMGTPDNPNDDWVSSDWIPNITEELRVAPVCGSFPQPPNQPKPPEGCGTFTEGGQEAGYWLFYDGDAADAPPGGWNGGNSWWRNRIILRYDSDILLYLGTYRANPAHPTCRTDTACPAGSVKFCGDLSATVNGSEWSAGKFEFCSRSL